MNIVNLNDKLKYTILDPSKTNMFLVGNSSEISKRLNLINRIYEMMINNEDEGHIRWVLYCELWCLYNN